MNTTAMIDNAVQTFPAQVRDRTREFGFRVRQWSIDEAFDLLRNTAAKDERPTRTPAVTATRPTLSVIMTCAANACGVSVDRAKTQRDDHSAAAKAIAAELASCWEYSYPEMAMEWGGGHSTWKTAQARACRHSQKLVRAAAWVGGALENQQ